MQNSGGYRGPEGPGHPPKKKTYCKIVCVKSRKTLGKKYDSTVIQQISYLV